MQSKQIQYNQSKEVDIQRGGPTKLWASLMVFGFIGLGLLWQSQTQIKDQLEQISERGAKLDARVLESNAKISAKKKAIEELGSHEAGASNEKKQQVIKVVNNIQYGEEARPQPESDGRWIHINSLITPKIEKKELPLSEYVAALGTEEAVDYSDVLRRASYQEGRLRRHQDDDYRRFWKATLAADRGAENVVVQFRDQQYIRRNELARILDKAKRKFSRHGPGRMVSGR